VVWEILPPSLANREGWANRLGLKICAQTPERRERLGLQSLLNFEGISDWWAEYFQGRFDRLVANSPLVEINAEGGTDRKTSKQRKRSLTKDQLALSRRCPTPEHRDTQAIENCQWSALRRLALQELIATLTNNQRLRLSLHRQASRDSCDLIKRERVGYLPRALGSLPSRRYGTGKNDSDDRFSLHLKEQAH